MEIWVTNGHGSQIRVPALRAGDQAADGPQPSCTHRPNRLEERNPVRPVLEADRSGRDRRGATALPCPPALWAVASSRGRCAPKRRRWVRDPSAGSRNIRPRQRLQGPQFRGAGFVLIRPEQSRDTQQLPRTCRETHRPHSHVSYHIPRYRDKPSILDSRSPRPIYFFHRFWR